MRWCEKATVNPSSPKPNTTPDVNSTDYKEAEQEFSIADGIITANQKDNKLSCGDMLMVADKYAYAAKEYRKAGAEEEGPSCG